MTPKPEEDPTYDKTSKGITVSNTTTKSNTMRYAFVALSCVIIVVLVGVLVHYRDIVKQYLPCEITTNVTTLIDIRDNGR
jgi:predicted RND superfamily exporter protein